MRCPKCDQSIPSQSRFCLYCGAPLATENPSPQTEAETQVDLPKSQSSVPEPPRIIRHNNWGVKINTGNEFLQPSQGRPSDCPEWAAQESDWNKWAHHGVVIWDNKAHVIAKLNAADATQLLGELQNNQSWKQTGITIIERTSEVNLSDLVPSKPGRKKKISKKAAQANAEPTDDADAKSRLCLRAAAAKEFYRFLEAHTALLRQMVAYDDKLADFYGKKVLPLLLGFHRRGEFNSIDLSNRKFTWVKREQSLSLVCNLPPDRATIQLCEDQLRWRIIIEQPGHAKWDWQWFPELIKAIDWAEQTLPKLQAEQEERDQRREQEQLEEQTRVAALPQKDLTAYRINPSDLEPKRLAYRVIVYVEHVPYHFTAIEISFGEKRLTDEEFYTPTMMARELHLSANQVEVTQIARMMGWYYIRSVASYYDVQTALHQAQQMWDQSAIVNRFQENKVIRARYGYEEMETEYRHWIGGCDDPNRPWSVPPTRAEYLSRLALRVTLIHALDVNGFRQYLGMSFKDMTDEQLLESMHRQRSRSTYFPLEARRESQCWLLEHPGKD